MIRALIVDDEPLARRGIRNHLLKAGDIEVVGEAGNGREAIKAIRQKTPDLVFLDVQMPLLDGFGVVRTLSADEMPTIVFVTAFDEHAIDAFEVNALDYLLKPVDPDRFDRTIERVRTKIADRDNAAHGKNLLATLRHIAPAASTPYLSRVAVKVSGRVIFVSVDNVEWISSEGNYVGLHVGTRTHLIRETMEGIEAKLDPECFVRIRRSLILSIPRIKELHPIQNGEYDIVLSTGPRFTSSRRYRRNLDRLLTN